MSTLINFLQNTRKRSILWWLKYYHQEILNSLYQKKVSNKVDNSWKKLQIKNSYYPALYPVKNKENVFLYLEVFGSKNLWKRN